MADFDVDWLVDFRNVIVDTVQGCTLKTLFRSPYINKVNWRERIRGGTLPVPFQAFDLAAEIEDTKWAPMAGNCYVQPIAVYCVYSESDPNSSINSNGLAPFDVIGYCEAQMHTLREAFIAYTGENFQILPETLPILDVSKDMEVNRVFTIGNSPLWCGKLTAQLLVGVTSGTG